MLPWYRREGIRIAAMALAAGLVLGGLIALAVGRPELARFGGGAERTAPPPIA